MTPIFRNCQWYTYTNLWEPPVTSQWRLKLPPGLRKRFQKKPRGMWKWLVGAPGMTTSGPIGTI